MRSEEEIREAVEVVMRAARMAYDRKDRELMIKFASMKGILSWTLREDSDFGNLLGALRQ